MWYYYIIELIPDRCEQGKFLSVKIYGLEFVFKFLKNCENNRFRYAVTVWFFDKTEREKAKEESALEGNSVHIN